MSLPKNRRPLGLLIVLITVILAASCCKTEEDVSTIADLNTRVAAYAPTSIEADLEFLPASEKAVLDTLVAASRIMHEIFIEQAWPDRESMLASLNAL